MAHMIISAVLLIVLCGTNAIRAESVTLEYAPAPVDNPLKGLVPYAGDHGRWFPHSMEFSYVPLSPLVVGRHEYDWRPLERVLDEIAGRGHQAIFRVYVEYPGKRDGIPQYLLDGGLKVHEWRADGINRTPDYADAALRECLRDFVAKLGEKYDGDPRIGFVTAGLLGRWGEWHTYPRTDLWADQTTQREVLDAYEAAFDATPILLRYPAGRDHGEQARNDDRAFGYHDDSFAWATLDTGKPGDEWFFEVALNAAGPLAVEKWRTQPIGGEIRPEAWGKVFDAERDDERIQDFATCVERTHVSWLMDTGLFQKGTWSRSRHDRAVELVRRMGYEFHVPTASWTLEDGRLDVEVEVENRGVAPFYHAWAAEFALLDGDGRVVVSTRGENVLSGLLPGSKPRTWRERLDLSKTPAGGYQLAVRVPNPLEKGYPVRFANATQDQHAPGWLTLGTIRVP